MKTSEHLVLAAIQNKINQLDATLAYLYPKLERKAHLRLHVETKLESFSWRF